MMKDSLSISSAASRARVIHASVKFTSQPFATPLIISSGAIDTLTQADALVRVEIGGRQVEGRGCIYLSDLWAWPDQQFSHAQRDAAMRDYCLNLAAWVPQRLGEESHPLVAGLRLHEHVAGHLSGDHSAAFPPLLARCVCASIFDAALHDAVGKALSVSAFELYDQEQEVAETDELFGGPSQTFRAIRKLLQAPPTKSSPAWWLVGKADDLEEQLRPVVESQGFFAFKIKIHGRDAVEDAARVSEVAAAARRWGVEGLRLSVDSNEANPDPASVLEFLDRLESIDAQAYAALEMIEQPTGRDIEKYAYDWTRVAARKPVMVDEGLQNFAAMRIARDQHWSGFALKTCKGHSFALTAAAWAHEHGLALSLQDLTNPGASMVHAALFAARVPTLNGVELNSPQFTPAANDGWVEAYPGLFRVRDGRHRYPPMDTLGLGGALPQSP